MIRWFIALPHRFEKKIRKNTEKYGKIRENTEKIRENTGEIRENTGKIRENTGNLKFQISLKKVCKMSETLKTYHE